MLEIKIMETWNGRRQRRIRENLRGFMLYQEGLKGLKVFTNVEDYGVCQIFLILYMRFSQFTFLSLFSLSKLLNKYIYIFFHTTVFIIYELLAYSVFIFKNK